MSGAMIREAVMLAGICSFVPLACAAVCGLCVSVLQAATQIQEQTTAYIVKLITISLVIFLFGSFASQKLLQFTQSALLGLR